MRNISTANQWNYVSSKENPEDFASCRMHANELASQSLWLRGSYFLLNPFINEGKQKETNVPLDLNNIEVKKCQSLSSICSVASELDKFDHVVSWYRLKRAVVICLKFKDKHFKTWRLVCRVRMIQRACTILLQSRICLTQNIKLCN